MRSMIARRQRVPQVCAQPTGHPGLWRANRIVRAAISVGTGARAYWPNARSVGRTQAKVVRHRCPKVDPDAVPGWRPPPEGSHLLRLPALVLDYFAKEPDFFPWRSRMQAGLAKAADPDVPARQANSRTEPPRHGREVPAIRGHRVRCSFAIWPCIDVETGSHLWSNQRVCFIASAPVNRLNRHHIDAVPIA
jgi:hypothetical protein